MQPYNYSIDLPKPPADNFLQDIMGIAQLQAMGQQQKIAAQQAQFQKEMQPLEMDKVREQIKAAQASAAQSAASTRGLNISADEAKRQQDYIKEVDAFTSKPVSEWAKQDVERLASLSITRDPKIGKGLQDFYASQKKPELELIDNYAIKAGIAISQGRKDVADKITKQGIAEADKLGFKTASAFLKFGDSQIADDPAEAYATIVGHLARDKNKLDQFIAASELKGKLAETEEKAKKEKAATEGQLLDNRIKQYEADTGMSLKDIAKNKEEKFKTEAAERAHIESNPFVRKYIDSRTAFEIIKNAPQNASGDETLLTQFVKMGDPGSVVSVTEKGGTRNVTLSDYATSLYAKLKNDGSLGDTKRKELKEASFRMLQAPQKQYKEYQDNLEPVYRERGLNPKNIFVLPSSEQILEEAKQQAAGSTGAINTGTMPVAPVSAEESRIRSMLRPAAGFGNTMTPSQFQPQGGTFQGTPSDVDAILKQYGPR